jgi:hypothetical protein
MHRLFITALLASVAVAPAYAGKKDGGGDLVDRAERAAEKYDSRIDRLENRLEDAGDTERQRIENIIESITEKYEAKWGLPEEPPPDNPPPEEPEEPVQLFKDDFSRDQTEPGNGWTGTDASVSDQQLLLGTVYQTVDLGGLKYKSITVSWDMIVEVNSAGDVVGQDAKMYWSEGDILADKTLGVTTVMNEFPDQRHYSFTTQEKDPLLYLEPYYDSFSFGFDAGRTRIDNVVVTGVLWEEPTGDFVGF